MALPLKAVLRATFGTVLVLYPFWAWYGLSHWGPAAVAAGLAAVTFLPRFSDKVAGGLGPLGHRGLSMRSSCILRTGRTHAVISSPCQCLSSLGLRHNASPQSNAHGRTFRPDERCCAAA